MRDSSSDDIGVEIVDVEYDKNDIDRVSQSYKDNHLLVFRGDGCLEISL